MTRVVPEKLGMAENYIDRGNQFKNYAKAFS